MLNYPTKNSGDWEAEDDARTLANAEVIKGDAERSRKATEMARKIAEHNQAEKEAMEKIGDAKALYNNSPDLFKEG